MGNNQDAYIVNPDGSISETVSAKGLDDVIRAFIRVAANQSGKTSAYKAQRKAIKYLKKYSDCVYPDIYVKDLELREFPYEFKRAELGKKYTRLIWLASTLWICVYGIIGYYWIVAAFKKLNAEFAKLSDDKK